jgi:hypothetical protein
MTDHENAPTRGSAGRGCGEAVGGAGEKRRERVHQHQGEENLHSAHNIQLQALEYVVRYHTTVHQHQGEENLHNIQLQALDTYM